jgi:hypothetical protein
LSRAASASSRPPRDRATPRRPRPPRPRPPAARRLPPAPRRPRTSLIVSQRRKVLVFDCENLSSLTRAEHLTDARGKAMIK